MKGVKNWESLMKGQHRWCLMLNFFLRELIRWRTNTKIASGTSFDPVRSSKGVYLCRHIVTFVVLSLDDFFRVDICGILLFGLPHGHCKELKALPLCSKNNIIVFGPDCSMSNAKVSLIFCGFTRFFMFRVIILFDKFVNISDHFGSAIFCMSIILAWMN